MSDEAINWSIAFLDGWREAFPKGGAPHKETERGGILLPYRWVNERTRERRMELPDYLKDANCVISLLERCGPGYEPWIPVPKISYTWYQTNPEFLGWGVDLGHAAKAYDMSFCRAVCLAWLAAHQINITT